MKTLTEPTADAQVVAAYNRGMQVSEQVDLLTGTKYALCLLKLNSAVTSSDYPTLATDVRAVTGIQDISLVVDHETRASVPTGKKLVAVLELNLRLEDAV